MWSCRSEEVLPCGLTGCELRANSHRWLCCYCWLLAAVGEVKGETVAALRQVPFQLTALHQVLFRVTVLRRVLFRVTVLRQVQFRVAVLRQVQFRVAVLR